MDEKYGERQLLSVISALESKIEWQAEMLERAAEIMRICFDISRKHSCASPNCFHLHGSDVFEKVLYDLEKGPSE